MAALQSAADLAAALARPLRRASGRRLAQPWSAATATAATAAYHVLLAADIHGGRRTAGRRPGQRPPTPGRRLSQQAAKQGPLALHAQPPQPASAAGTHAPPPENVAVLGGGLTGLVTAYYLAELLPAARITLYEASDRLGGWIDSTVVDVPAAGDGRDGRDGPDGAATDARQIVFEAGARMVMPQTRSTRYDDLVFLDLVNRLDLVDQLRVSTLRPAQYVYYPDHLVQVSMKANSGLPGLVAYAQHVLREPLFAGIGWAALSYVLPLRAKRREVLRRAQATLTSANGLPPDEAIGSFFARQLGACDGLAARFGAAPGRSIVGNMLSAVMHGIYGGDVWRLSIASSPMRSRWLQEALAPVIAQHARLLGEELAARALHQGLTDREMRQLRVLTHDHELVANCDWELGIDLTASFMLPPADTADTATANRLTSPNPARHASLALASTRWTQMGFAGGFGVLTDALAARLAANPNVTLRRRATVADVRMAAAADAVEVATADGAAARYDKVISTLAAPALHAVTADRLPALAREHAVTIMVVNLYFRETGLNWPHDGFGYLVPQTVPLEQNPECALGVIFDSDREAAVRPLFPEETDMDLAASVDRDADRDAAARRPPAGSMFTVMLGGHYWDGLEPADLPTDADAAAMAEAVLRRHLGSLPDHVRPAAVRTKLCRGCIPQHYVGHSRRMAAAEKELLAAYAGRVAVAGGSFTANGPGVLPSLRAARDIALATAAQGYRTLADADRSKRPPLAHVGPTGLGRFGSGAHTADAVRPTPREEMPLRYGNGL